MILRQFLNTDPVAISYLFGCGGKAAAAVVDPVGEIAPYLRAAQETGMRILSVIDTHIHADHLSAGRRLAEAAGAEYVLFAEAEAAQPFQGVRDSEVLELGNVSVEAIQRPRSRYSSWPMPSSAARRVRRRQTATTTSNAC